MVVMSKDGCIICEFEKFIWEIEDNSIRAFNGVTSRVFGEYETREQAISSLENLYQSKRMKVESCKL